MTVAEVVAMLVSLGTLLGFLGKLIITISNLNYTLKSTNAALNKMEEDFDKSNKHNTESHKRIWDHNSMQDEAIEDHEIRICLIEEKNNMQVGRRNKQ